MDISKFQLKRVNPFQGLVIDADTWRDAHNYHREHQRLHILAFHKTGIISGLEVTANNPPDLSVNISPGIAIDPEGNVIVMQQKQSYRLQTVEKGTVYLVIQFREIPGEPYQPPEGGQATRIIEAYRVQERDQLPSEPYVELARFDFDPAQKTIKAASNAARPGINEINLNFRESTTAEDTGRVSVPARETLSPPPPVKENVVSLPALRLGHAVLGEGTSDLHLQGLRNLVKEMNRQGNINVTIDENINLKQSDNQYNLIYLTGSGRFEITGEQQAALGLFLQSGGIIFGDGCSGTSIGGEARGAKEFGLAFNRLAGQLNCKLGMVQRGHPVLSADNLFSEVPPGCEPGMLLEGGNMVCSSSDYGCAWQGGHSDKPLPREVIRSAFEIGINVVSQAKKGRR